MTPSLAPLPWGFDGMGNFYRAVQIDIKGEKISAGIPVLGDIGGIYV